MYTTLTTPRTHGEKLPDKPHKWYMEGMRQHENNSSIYLGSSHAIKIWLHINGAHNGMQFYNYNKQIPHRLPKPENQKNKPSILTFTTTN